MILVLSCLLLLKDPYFNKCHVLNDISFKLRRERNKVRCSGYVADCPYTATTR